MALGLVAQPSLLGLRPVGFDSCALDRPSTPIGAGAWILHLPGWLSGHEQVFDALVASTRWHASRRPMYDRMVEVPRLTATLPRDGAGHPILVDIAAALSDRIGEPFVKTSLALYRNGSDSVAPHGDQIARDLDTTVMATVSLGATRGFRLTPVDGGTPTLRLDLAGGDLVVMGGTVQRTWRHAVPKTARAVGPRVCVMFRPPWLG